MSLLKGREFWSTVKKMKTQGKSMNKMQNATPAFLIPLAVLPLQKRKKDKKPLFCTDTFSIAKSE